jgi:hypothetical protein
MHRRETKLGKIIYPLVFHSSSAPLHTPSCFDSVLMLLGILFFYYYLATMPPLGAVIFILKNSVSHLTQKFRRYWIKNNS